MKKIAILGGGESGVGAALLAKEKGYDVFLSDLGQIGFKFKKKLNNNKIKYEENKHTSKSIIEADEIIKSPGIPREASIIKKILKIRKPIISEIEFASRFIKKPIIAITGSNGKTTTTKLLYHLLKYAGKKVAMAGNVGNSLSGEVSKNKNDYYIVELSSFQLEDIVNFKPSIAVILNITSDHLDRYEYSVEKYGDAKFNILKNMDLNDHLIYFQDDKNIYQRINNNNFKVEEYPISIKSKVKNGIYLENHIINVNLNSHKYSIPDKNFTLKGTHNTINAMSAIAVASILGIKKEKINNGLKSFKAIEHRMEFIRKINEISFYNDSKATNVESTYAALNSFNGPIIWIAGGIDKGNDYTKIKTIIKNKVKALICLGKDNKKLINEFKGTIDIIFETIDIKEAVEKSFILSNPGDIVLLSPSCSSFDLFINYEDRGVKFKNIVKNLQ